MNLHFRIHILTIEKDITSLRVERFEEIYKTIYPDKIYLFVLLKQTDLINLDIGNFLDKLQQRICFHRTRFSVLPFPITEEELYLEKIIEIQRVEQEQGNDVYMNAWGSQITPIYATWMNQMFNTQIYIANLVENNPEGAMGLNLPRCDVVLPNRIDVFLLRLLQAYFELTQKKTMMKGILLDTLLVCGGSTSLLYGTQIDRPTLRILTSFTEKSTKQYNRLKSLLVQLRFLKYIELKDDKHGVLELTPKGRQTATLFGQYYNISLGLARQIISLQLHIKTDAKVPGCVQNG